jgi:hypothetical protein
MLLLGRLANFASKDLARKRKAYRGTASTTGSPPPFPGMFPTQGIFQIPLGFSPPRDTSRDTSTHGSLFHDVDSYESLQAALEEWEKLHQAFDILRRHLGLDFQPKADVDGVKSPFGPRLRYQNYAIAGIWMNFYMGLIHLHRSHPSMPPAAMQAAGLAAHQTGGYAIEIGRIAAGLADDCTQLSEINTLIGAAFIESAFCLFVAAVQVSFLALPPRCQY